MNTQREGYLLRKYLGEEAIKGLRQCNAYIAGGAITALFSGQKIRDWDIYFRTKEDCEKAVTWFGINGVLANETDTYHWLEEKKKYRTEHPLEFVYDNKHIAYACTPCAEQDVIAIYHELIGLGLIKGVRFLCTSERDRYDGCYVGHYTDNNIHGYHPADRPLGVSSKIISPRESKPQILEYKFDLDGLVSDFARETKFQNEINGIVCWTIGRAYEENYIVRSYLVGEEGSGRQLYGATHSLWHERQKIADVVCVSDLMRFFSEPEAVKAEHKTRFKN